MGPGLTRASAINGFWEMLRSCCYLKVIYKGYVSVHIDRKFKELKLNSIIFLAKMHSK